MFGFVTDDVFGLKKLNWTLEFSHYPISYYLAKVQSKMMGPIQNIFQPLPTKHTIYTGSKFKIFQIFNPNTSSVTNPSIINNQFHGRKKKNILCTSTSKTRGRH